MGKKSNFEENITALESIVARLESGECSLEESIALFEEGMKLSAGCTKQLETAKQKIVSLTQVEEETGDA